MTSAFIIGCAVQSLKYTFDCVMGWSTVIEGLAETPDGEGSLAVEHETYSYQAEPSNCASDAQLLGVISDRTESNVRDWCVFSVTSAILNRANCCQKKMGKT